MMLDYDGLGLMDKPKYIVKLAVHRDDWFSFREKLQDGAGGKAIANWIKSGTVTIFDRCYKETKNHNNVEAAAKYADCARSCQAVIHADYLAEDAKKAEKDDLTDHKREVLGPLPQSCQDGSWANAPETCRWKKPSLEEVETQCKAKADAQMQARAKSVTLARVEKELEAKQDEKEEKQKEKEEKAEVKKKELDEKTAETASKNEAKEKAAAAKPCVGSNCPPPDDSYVAKPGSGPCQCRGSGWGLLSCGKLCCAASPYTDPRPGQKHSAKKPSDLCYRRKVDLVCTDPKYPFKHASVDVCYSDAGWQQGGSTGSAPCFDRSSRRRSPANWCNIVGPCTFKTRPNFIWPKVIANANYNNLADAKQHCNKLSNCVGVVKDGNGYNCRLLSSQYPGHTWNGLTGWEKVCSPTKPGSGCSSPPNCAK